MSLRMPAGLLTGAVTQVLWSVHGYSQQMIFPLIAYLLRFFALPGFPVMVHVEISVFFINQSPAFR